MINIIGKATETHVKDAHQGDGSGYRNSINVAYFTKATGI
jgi:hypothetical protein